MARGLCYGVTASLLILLALGVEPNEARPLRTPPAAAAPDLADPPLPPPRPTIEQVRPPAPPQAPPLANEPTPAPPAKPAENTAPAQPGTAPQEPIREPIAACLRRLRDRGAVVEEAAPAAMPDPNCTVDQPVTVRAIEISGVRIDLPDHPLIACATAETFADFLGEFMVPLAKGTYGQMISSIGTGPGLECRPRNNVAGAKLSAHGQGLAIDIAQFRLADGPLYKVGVFANPQDRDFDRAVRAGACGYFHTSLGPGSDAEHANHWHMDLEPRGSSGTSRFCQ